MNFIRKLFNLSSDEIEYIKEYSDEKNAHDCSICMEGLTKEIIGLPCKHVYHMNCIGKWLLQENNDNCPLCRKSINAKKFINICTGDLKEKLKDKIKKDKEGRKQRRRREREAAERRRREREAAERRRRALEEERKRQERILEAQLSEQWRMRIEVGAPVGSASHFIGIVRDHFRPRDDDTIVNNRARDNRDPERRLASLIAERENVHLLIR